MARNQFAESHFHDEDAARVWFEHARWPNGPICPKCGSAKHYRNQKARCVPLCGLYVSQGLHRYDRDGDGASPRQAYPVGRRVPYGSLQQEGILGPPAHRKLGCEYKTAWFMHHRIMEAMRHGGLDSPAWWQRQGCRGRRNLFGKIPKPRRCGPIRKVGSPVIHASVAPKINARSLRWWSAAASVRSFHVPRAYNATVVNIVTEIFPRIPSAYRRKQASISSSVTNSPSMKL